MTKITETNIETFAIETLQSIGWKYIHGLSIAPGAEHAERESFEQIILTNRLRKAVARLNPDIPADAQEQAVQKVLRIYSPDLLHNNETFHQFLIEKVKIPYQQYGYERSYEVSLIDFAHPLNNEFLAVNQYTIIENNQTKRPDILLFVNGIPLVVIELKNAADENATIRKAYDQIQTYKATIPSLFTYNAVCIISDGIECRGGSVSAGFSRFMAWPVCVPAYASMADRQRTGREITDKQRTKAKWTKLEAIVGNQQRVKNLAKDIVTHFEQRQAVFDGKGMIVAISRRIAVDLYNEIIRLRPEWHNAELLTDYFIERQNRAVDS